MPFTFVLICSTGCDDFALLGRAHLEKNENAAAREQLMNRTAGAPAWTDLLTSDPRRSTDFYTQLFGWTAAEGSPEFGGYFVFMNDGVPVAGCMPNQPAMEVPDGWGVYLATADAKATVEAVVKEGGTVREQAMDIADLGTQAVFTDTVGARVGCWQAGTFPGFPPYSGQPGTPAYFELITRGYERAVAFYTDAFGWNGRVAGGTPDSRLTVLADGDQVTAGIMDGTTVLAEDQPDAWGVYFKVADTDAALAAVTRLGGTVTDPAADTPYGRLAGATDPVGTRFKLVG
jgi:predicted enzyme related to lactoylglutathione lyase